MIILIAIAIIIILVSTSGTVSTAASVINPVISPAVTPAEKVPETVYMEQPVTVLAAPEAPYKEPVSTFVRTSFKPILTPIQI